MPKKYSIIVDNDEVIAVEVDGVRYDRYEQVPDDEDRGRMMMIVEDFPDAKFMFPESKPSKLPNLIVWLFLALAVVFLIVAVLSGIGTARTIAREVAVPGRVVDMVEQRNSEGQPFYYPVVEFALPGHDPQAVQVYEGNWPAAYDIGEEVTVVYDREQPDRARIKSGLGTVGLWTVTIIFGVLGLGFGAGAAFAAWVTRSSALREEAG